MTYLKETKRDTVNPKALLTFMRTRWKADSTTLPQRHPFADAFAARRAAVSKKFPKEVLIIPTGHEKVRANDTHYRFRPGSDFFWLTGNDEPDCVLVMVPRQKSGHDAHLFVEPNAGHSNETFFTDRNKGALWVGPRLGVEQSQARFGVEKARGLDELASALGSFPLARVLRGVSAKVDALRSPAHERPPDKELAWALSELRLIKDALEVKLLKEVIASTQRGFEDVIAGLPTASNEREVEGLFAMRARVEGNDVGYGTIAAAGANACILHWTKNHSALRKGDLLLLDAGVEGDSLYTADITRTVPMSGRFSPAQREIYTLVWQAQQAALEAVRPGNDFMEPNRQAMRVLAEGLVSLGILKTSAEVALADENQFYKRYSLHNISHMLGLDVHDCAKARMENYRYGPLRAGMVLTIEPGLYFQLDDLTVPAKYRGIGVRIEDDVLVTKKGMVNLSAGMPTEATEVERWVQRVQQAPRHPLVRR